MKIRFKRDIKFSLKALSATLVVQLCAPPRHHSETFTFPELQHSLTSSRSVARLVGAESSLELKCCLHPMF